MCCPSATFVVWSSAWLQGRAAPDDVLDALQVWGESQEVAAADDAVAEIIGLPAAGAPAVPPAQLLAALRRLKASEARLVLPAAGDARGLGGASTFAAAALSAGEAALFPDAGVGVVPNSPAEGVLRWTVHRLEHGNADEHIGIGDAEHSLVEAVRTSAGILTELNVARDRPDAHRELRAHLKATPRLDWPDGMPGRALRVLQRADEVAAIAALAAADDPGGALSASAAMHRAQALRPLAAAVRDARRAAVGEAVRVLGERADRHP
ncbi:MAG: hypothetical protein ACRDQW_03975 [Haloechinothrix sp.]